MNYYSVSQIAGEAKVSEKTVRRVIKVLDIDVQLKQGNMNLYSEEAVKKIKQQIAINHMNQGNNSYAGKSAVKEVISENIQTSPSLSVNDFSLISTIVAATVKATIAELQPMFSGLSAVQSTKMSLEAPKLDSRAHITQLVRNFAQASKQPYQDVYSMLYTEFGYRTHSNPSKCAMNRDMKVIDYIESTGQIGQLEALAVEFLIPPKKYEKDWLAE